MDSSAFTDSGLAFSAGARHAVASSGQAHLHLENPSDSGFNIYIAGFSAYTGETARAQISFFTGSTSPGSVVAKFNHDVGNANPGVAIIKTGTVALNGGTELSPRAGVTSRDNFKFESGLLVRVPPGQSVAMLCRRPSGLSGSEDIDLNVHWLEAPV